MNKAPADLAKEIKRLERRSRQLTRSIGVLRQAIDVLREHEAFHAELAPSAHRTLRNRNVREEFSGPLSEQANDDGCDDRQEPTLGSSDKSVPMS